MNVLKVIGWIFIPFIMIFIYWSKLSKSTRILASVWVIIFLIAGFTNSLEDTNNDKSVEAIVSQQENKKSESTAIEASNATVETTVLDNTDDSPTDILSDNKKNSTEALLQDQKQVKSTDLPAAATLSAHFIDVGNAASVLFILQDKDSNQNSNQLKTILIDAGDNDDEKRIVEYLKNEGISKLDVVIGTHPHSDHIGGLDAAIDAFEIGTIYMPKASSNTSTFEDVLTAIANKNLKVNTAKAGVSIALDPRLDIQLVGPVKNYDDLNDMSAVVRIQFGETSFLVTGDIEKTSEADIVASGANLKADVIQIAHHGSDTSSTDFFLDAVNPTHGVIQVGKDNNYGHPTENVLKRLNKQNIKIYRNDMQGTVVFTSDGQTLTVSDSEWKYVANSTSKPTEKPASNNDPSTPKSTEKAASTPTASPEAKKEETVYYANCAAVREAGKAPLMKGDPGYSTKLDRDKDGKACE